MLIFSENMLADFEEEWAQMQPLRPVVRLDALDGRRALPAWDRLGAMAASGAIDLTLARAYLSLMFVWLLPALAPERPAAPVGKDVLYRAMGVHEPELQAAARHPRQPRALWASIPITCRTSSTSGCTWAFRAYLNALRIDRAPPLPCA